MVGSKNSIVVIYNFLLDGCGVNLKCPLSEGATYHSTISAHLECFRGVQKPPTPPLLYPPPFPTAHKTRQFIPRVFLSPLYGDTEKLSQRSTLSRFIHEEGLGGGVCVRVPAILLSPWPRRWRREERERQIAQRSPARRYGVSPRHYASCFCWNIPCSKF